MSDRLTHVDAAGQARMVDVGDKTPSRRVAVAKAFVRVNPVTFERLKAADMPKGDVLGTAKLAGVMAAKKTAELIPLCHPLGLDFADVRLELDEAACGVRIEAEASLTGKTGVEMEAMTAASVAALTIYDMCKAVQKDIVIESVRLIYKSGGKSGEFKAE